jgi:hypothetical protein
MHAPAYASGYLTGTENFSLHPAWRLSSSQPGFRETSSVLPRALVGVFLITFADPVSAVERRSRASKVGSFDALSGHGSIPGYVAAVRQNAGELAASIYGGRIIGETRVLSNCGYATQFARL